jgi:hypothetical protein
MVVACTSTSCFPRARAVPQRQRCLYATGPGEIEVQRARKKETFSCSCNEGNFGDFVWKEVLWIHSFWESEGND